MYCKGNKVYITDELYYEVYRSKNRLIFAPCNKLKHEQRLFLNKMRKSYPLKIDTLKCAKPHSGKKWILKIDIKHFYNSIPYCDIESFVKSVCQNIEYANVNYYLDITTLNKKLPIGAPTSAHIANNCFKKVDLTIQNYCNIFSVTYTRYVDDLTFSSNDKRILKRIEKQVKEILLLNGYEINIKKLEYMSTNKQQNILGLIVNDGKVRINNDEKRRIRAMLHSFAVSNSSSQTKDLKHCVWDNCKKEKLKGYLAYIKHVDIEYFEHLKLYVIRLSAKYNFEIAFLKIKKTT